MAEHFFVCRFDKKKKSSGYKKAISEAKYDAVLNAQYLESLMDEEAPGLPSNLEPGSTSIPSIKPSKVILTSQASSKLDDSGNSLVNAFIRGSGDGHDCTVLPTSIPVSGAVCNDTTVASDKMDNSSLGDATDYHTIFVPSPLSLLDNT